MIATTALATDVAEAFLGEGKWRPAAVRRDGPWIYFEGGARAAVATVDVTGLAEAALALAAIDGGIERSNVGGFHSDDDLYETCPAVRRLVETAAAFAKKLGDPPAEDASQRPLYRVTGVEGARIVGDDQPRLLVSDRSAAPQPKPEAWFNVNDVGHYNCLHSHAGARWAGVAFVQAPPTRAPPVEHSAHLLFRVRPPARDQGLYAALAPVPGLLILFPPALQHAVLPVAPLDDDPNARLSPAALRISLSFNLYAT